MTPEEQYFGREARRPALNVGSGPKYLGGWLNLERWPDPGDHTAARPERVRFDLLGDAHILPFSRNSLATVYFRHTLEHLEHPLIALREAFRALEPGGRLRVEVPNAANSDSEKDTHLYSWTRDALVQIVEYAGYQQVEYVDHRHEYPPYEQVKGNNHGVEAVCR